MSAFKWIGLITGCIMLGYEYARYEEKKRNDSNVKYSGTIHIITNADNEKEMYLELDTDLDNIVNREDITFRILNN